MNLARPSNSRWCGAFRVAPVFFVTVFTVEGWLRPGYDQASMFVSELSIGPRGWVQVANFVITGVLLLYFTRGVAIHLNWNKTARVGITLLRIIGWSLVLSGLFVTDPSALFNQVSVHGLLHGLFGVLVFSLAPVSCFVYSACFRPDPVWWPLAPVTLSAGIIIAVWIVFQYLTSCSFCSNDENSVQDII